MRTELLHWGQRLDELADRRIKVIEHHTALLEAGKEKITEVTDMLIRDELSRALANRAKYELTLDELKNDLAHSKRTEGPGWKFHARLLNEVLRDVDNKFKLSPDAERYVLLLTQKIGKDIRDFHNMPN
jgi:hypothetical protein